MHAVASRLHASHPQPLPFAPSLLIRAYLLEREEGNLLIYGSGGLTADEAVVNGLGGVARRYLNHQHEAAFACGGAPTFGAPLHVHEDDARAAGGRCAVDATFGERHRVGDDLEVLPIPGHTPGATAYLWTADGERLLFTGDSIYLDGGEWVAAVLASSDRARYVESLELLRDLEFDTLVPWAASDGGPLVSRQDPAEGGRRVQRSSTGCAAGRIADAHQVQALGEGHGVASRAEPDRLRPPFAHLLFLGFAPGDLGDASWGADRRRRRAPHLLRRGRAGPRLRPGDRRRAAVEALAGGRPGAHRRRAGAAWLPRPADTTYRRRMERGRGRAGPQRSSVARRAG